MRNTLRLLANVKPGRYLEAGNPTGLTGLFTHPSPRSALLFLYNSTLDKLKAFPEHSVYRQSAEALTKHRMNIIESIKPEGYDEWEKKAVEKMQKYPEAFQPGESFASQTAGGQVYVSSEEDEDEREEPTSSEDSRTFEEKAADTAKVNIEEWTSSENSQTFQEKAAETARVGRREDYPKIVNWEPEPQLEASQISEAETRIGGGLIEEVIQVAEGELKLVEIMAESQVWDELEETPPQGQWDYFARDQHTSGTQEPPNK